MPAPSGIRGGRILGEPEVEELKRQSRVTWAAGRYHAIAELIWEVGQRIADLVRVRAGEDVLDVACGTGNASIPAAAAGARVVGLDLTPELFDDARARAAEAGVEVEWVEGDAESLPFAEGSFDAVLSTFGCMFAPRHDVVARELGRVLRPGGRLGLCTWPTEGFVASFFAALARHLPPPPPIAQSPLLWGDESHVQSLFDDTPVGGLRFQRRRVTAKFGSVERAVRLYEQTFGPVVKARELLESQGAWHAARRDLAAAFADHMTADGTAVYDYVVVLGRARA